MSRSVEQERPNFSQKLIAACQICACFVLCYNGTNWLTAQRAQLGTAVFEWEFAIPFLPWLIIPYWSVDIFFIFSPFFAKDKQELKALVAQLTFGILFASCCFLLFPLRLLFVRPEVPGLLGALFVSLDNFHNFYNLAPSLHIVIRGILWRHYIPKTSGITQIAVRVWFILIGASTLFCWQHHVIDIFTGYLLGAFALQLFPNEPQRVEVDATRRVNANLRIGVYYCLGALAFLLLSAMNSPTTLFFLWPASSLLTLALAYCRFGPMILGKNDGYYFGSTRFLLLPYHLAAYISLLLQTRKHPPFYKLEDSLFVGRRLSEAEVRTVLPREVSAVLDLTAEFPEPDSMKEKVYCNIPVLDLTAPSQAQLEAAVEFLQSQSSTYIHCALGRSRSFVIAAAFLVRKHPETPIEEILAHLTQAYPTMILKKEYQEALREFARNTRRS